MYPSSLEQEKFVVSIVNCRRSEGYMKQDQSTVDWEVTRAIKCCE